MRRADRVWLVGLALAVLWGHGALAAPAERSGVVLVLIPTLTLHEAERMPAVSRALREGAVALMSSRVGRSLQAPFADIELDPLASGYLTLSCGSRAAAGQESALAFGVNELTGGVRAGDVWAGLRHRPAPAGGIVAPWLELAKRQGSAAPYEIPVGALGSALREAGIRACVLGNADTPEEVHREAALFVLDKDGRAPTGDVSPGLTLGDRRFAFGLRTDTERIARELRSALRDCRFVVVETGDPARCARSEDMVIRRARPRLRALALSTADTVVRDAMHALPSGFRLVITSPGQTDDPEAPGADRLAPLIVYGGAESRGLLASASTRRAGVVANTDLASSICSWLGVPRQIGAGQPIYQAGGAGEIGQIYRDAQFQDSARAVVYVFVYVSALLLAIAAALLVSGRGRAAGALSFAPPSAAIAMLLSAAVYPSPGALGEMMGAAAIAGTAAGLWRRRGTPAGALAALAVAAVAAAYYFGLFAHAPGSYEIQGGARYYGIGNEYGGLLVGAVVFVGGTGLFALSAAGRWAGAAVVIAVSLFAGHPGIGANAGVMLGGLFGAAALVASARKVNIRLFAASAAVVLLLVLGAAYVDSLRPAAQQSHFGRAIDSVHSDGLRALGEIATRKMALNFMLMHNSPWALLLLAACAGPLLVRILKLPPRRSTTPREMALWAATAALLVFNDSGVLAAAACALWLALDVSARPAA